MTISCTINKFKINKLLINGFPHCFYKEQQQQHAFPCENSMHPQCLVRKGEKQWKVIFTTMYVDYPENTIQSFLLVCLSWLFKSVNKIWTKLIPTTFHLLHYWSSKQACSLFAMCCKQVMHLCRLKLPPGLTASGPATSVTPSLVLQSAAGLIELQQCMWHYKTDLHCAQLVSINNYHSVCETGKDWIKIHVPSGMLSKWTGGKKRWGEEPGTSQTIRFSFHVSKCCICGPNYHSAITLGCVHKHARTDTQSFWLPRNDMLIAAAG